MMIEGSTLLVTPCEVPTTDVGLVPTKWVCAKRKNIENGERCSSIPIPNRKRLRRDTSSESRLSKVRWKDVLEEQCDSASLPSNEYSDEESEDSGTSSTIAESETWYSKKEYKQMLLDQSLTVHIMRSLRSLAGETVTIEYCEEIDSDNRRFDELIKKHQIDPEEYCERGLESYLSEERRNEVNAVRKLHKVLVIGEYVRQGMLGASNPELVRSVSLNQSRKSTIRAQKLAMVDQREAGASANTNNKSNGDQEHDSRRNQPPKKCTNKTVRPSIPVALRTFCGEGSFEPIRANESRVASERIRETLMKQELVHLLLQREHEQNQRASLLASLQLQEQEQLFHRNHQYLQRQQQEQQLQNQHNYQQQVQRLLLLQQQQHYESIQLASAAILGQHHR